MGHSWGSGLNKQKTLKILVSQNNIDLNNLYCAKLM